MIIRFLKARLRQVYFFSRAVQRSKLIKKVEAQEPKYREFIELMSNSEATGVSAHPWRALDLFKVFDSHEVRSVLELGSGTSTFLFARHLIKVGGENLISVDESQAWSDVTRTCLYRLSGELPEEVHFEVRKRVDGEEGSHYDGLLPGNVDLIYVDGPTVLRDGKKKLPNQDLLKLIANGARPDLIMVDGRHATVSAIRDVLSSVEYRFIPSSNYIFSEFAKLRDVKSLGKFDRHSIFVRNC